MKKEEAKAFRRLVELGAQSLGDKEVSTAPDVLPRMTYGGKLVKNGTRINWKGIIKRAAVDLWDNQGSDPDHAPDLWEDVLYRLGIRVIPAASSPGLAFSKGERGWWGDDLYESTMDGNVWTPESYPDRWNIVNEQEEEKSANCN